MTHEEATKIIAQWQLGHKKENLYSKADAKLTYVGVEAARVLSKHHVESVTKAMARIELYEKYPKFGQVLTSLQGVSTDHGGAGCQKWKNGDVIEYKGTIGIIGRDDDRARCSVPVMHNGGVCWQAADWLGGRATKIPQDEADAWVRKYSALQERGGVIRGLYEAMGQLKIKDAGGKTDAQRLADIRAGKRLRVPKEEA